METVGFVGVGKIGIADLRKSHQERLPRARLSPRLARRFREVRRRAGEVAGRHRQAMRRRFLLRADGGGHRRGCERTGRPCSFGASRPGDRRARLASECPTSKSTSRPLAAKGAAYLDGEVSGTPGMVAARKGVIYLGRRCGGRQEDRAGGQRLCRSQHLLRTVRRREQGQADQQPPGVDQHRSRRGGDGARAEGRRRHRRDDQGRSPTAVAARPSSASVRRGWHNASSSRSRARRSCCLTTSA